MKSPKIGDTFKLPKAQWPDEQVVLQEVAKRIRAAAGHQGPAAGPVEHSIPAELVKCVANVATQAWKARLRMTDPTSGQVPEEMKRIYRHIESILDSLHEVGLKIGDHTGEAFDYGLPLKVVAAQAKPGATQERVIETIKPTIYWQDRLIQMGEVVIATPPTPDSPA
jgi:hypothetical protein